MKERGVVELLALAAFAILFGWLASIAWWAMVAGIIILTIIVGLAHLWGRVIAALRKGGTGQRPEV